MSVSPSIITISSMSVNCSLKHLLLVLLFIIDFFCSWRNECNNTCQQQKFHHPKDWKRFIIEAHLYNNNLLLNLENSSIKILRKSISSESQVSVYLLSLKKNSNIYLNFIIYHHVKLICRYTFCSILKWLVLKYLSKNSSINTETKTTVSG